MLRIGNSKAMRDHMGRKYHTDVRRQGNAGSRGKRKTLTDGQDRSAQIKALLQILYHVEMRKQIDEMIYTIRNAGQAIIEICDRIPQGAEECRREIEDLNMCAFSIRQEIRNQEEFRRQEDKWLKEPDEGHEETDEEWYLRNRNGEKKND